MSSLDLSPEVIQLKDSLSKSYQLSERELQVNFIIIIYQNIYCLLTLFIAFVMTVYEHKIKNTVSKGELTSD